MHEGANSQAMIGLDPLGNSNDKGIHRDFRSATNFVFDIFRFCKDWDFFHLAAPCHILHIQQYKPPLEICAQKILSHHISPGTGLDH